MDFDVLAVVVLILALVAGNQKRKGQKAKTRPTASGDPAIPYAPAEAGESASDGGVRTWRSAQFEKDMQGVHERAKEKLAVRKEAAVQAQMLPREEKHTVDHDELKVHQPSMRPRVTTDAPAPLEPMEGVDPCHDALYEARTEEKDAYEPETAVPEADDAAQAILRGIIWSEVLTRPTDRWRIKRR